MELGGAGTAIVPLGINFLTNNLFAIGTALANLDPYFMSAKLLQLIDAMYPSEGVPPGGGGGGGGGGGAGRHGELRRRLLGDNYSQNAINVFRRYKKYENLLVDSPQGPDGIRYIESCPVTGCTPALTINDTKFEPTPCATYKTSDSCTADLCQWDPNINVCRDLLAAPTNTLVCGKSNCVEVNDEDDINCNWVAGDESGGLLSCPDNYYESKDRGWWWSCHTRECTSCDDEPNSNDLYCGRDSCSRDLSSDDLSGQDNCIFGSNQTNLMNCPCGYYHKEFKNATGGTIYNCDVRHCVKENPHTEQTIYCGLDKCDADSDVPKCNLIGYDSTYLQKCPLGYTQDGEKSNWIGCSKRICKKN
jgi:hypothetical protein